MTDPLTIMLVCTMLSKGQLGRTDVTAWILMYLCGMDIREIAAGLRVGNQEIADAIVRVSEKLESMK